MRADLWDRGLDRDHFNDFALPLAGMEGRVAVSRILATTHQTLTLFGAESGRNDGPPTVCVAVVQVNDDPVVV